MTKNWEKNYSWKKINFFGSKLGTIYLSLGLHKERPSNRRSLQLSKEAIQHFKTWTLKKNFYFCGSFLPFWIRIRIPNPDPNPLTRLNPDPIRIRVTLIAADENSFTTLADENNFYMLADVGGDDKRAAKHAARIQLHAATQDGTTTAYAR